MKNLFQKVHVCALYGSLFAKLFMYLSYCWSFNPIHGPIVIAYRFMITIGLKMSNTWTIITTNQDINNQIWIWIHRYRHTCQLIPCLAKITDFVNFTGSRNFITLLNTRRMQLHGIIHQKCFYRLEDILVFMKIFMSPF